jgi:NDP-sugar pyrophosphorylase family protein
VLAPSECRWDPVGTPAEYLEANLHPQRLSYFDADARARAIGARLEGDLVVGAGATLGRGVVLERAVVWDGERVPDGFCARGGIYAGGTFHAVTVERDAG